MKRTKIKRKSKTPLVKAKGKLWELCKQLVRKRDGHSCVSCGKTGLVGKGWHTGHFRPSAACGGFLRYNLRNLHSQCKRCNINLGGNGGAYSLALERKYGKEFVLQIEKDMQKIIKLDIIFVQNKIDEYTVLLELSTKKLLEYTKSL